MRYQQELFSAIKDERFDIREHTNTYRGPTDYGFHTYLMAEVIIAISIIRKKQCC